MAVRLVITTMLFIFASLTSLNEDDSRAGPEAGSALFARALEARLRPGSAALILSGDHALVLVTPPFHWAAPTIVLGTNARRGPKLRTAQHPRFHYVF